MADDGDVLEISSEDVNITDEGGVQILNLKLAEAVKAALAAQASAGRSAATRAAADTNYALCGSNFSSCGKATAKPLKVAIR